MSLINKMLQDLDARGSTRGEGVPPEIRTVATRERRLPLGRIAAIAGGVLLALGAVAWFVFPLKGRTYDAPPAPVPAATVAPAAPAVPATAAAPAAAVRAEKPAALRPAPAAVEAPLPAPAARDKVADAPRKAALPQPQRREGERKLREEQARAASRAKVDATWLAALKRKEAAGGSASAPAAAEGRVETERQGAENAYRRALAALQEGRVSEAIASLQAALRTSPRHEAARQTLVGLLIENNRGDEAMTELQQALTLDPRQPALAMLLARLQIERGKTGIDVLLRTLPYAAGNGDYHAFLGGALQRQNRFREAAEQYQTALRTTPDNAVWWMGLGMALQGEKRNAEALDAFRQAKALGSLPPELQAFVERRLQQVGR